MNAIQARWSPYQVSSPLLEKPYVLKADMLKIIEQDGLGTQRLYKLGLEHSNCGGWCIKAGQKQYRILLEKWPERFKESSPFDTFPLIKIERLERHVQPL